MVHPSSWTPAQGASLSQQMLSPIHPSRAPCKVLMVLVSPSCTHLGRLCSTLLSWDLALFKGSSYEAGSPLGLLGAGTCVL